MNHEHVKHDEPAEDEEIKIWKKKLIFSWLFTIPIAIFMFSGRLFGIEILPESWMVPILLVLGFPVLFIFGWDTIKSGMRGLFTFYFNMDSLIALGTIVAYITGIVSFSDIVSDYS